MKKLMALTLAAALAFGSSVVVLGNEAVVNDEDYAYEEYVLEEEELEEEYVEEYVYEEVVVTVEVITVENVPFTGVARDFIGTGGLVVGRIPAFANNAGLTTRISNFVSDTYNIMGMNNQLPAVFGNNVIFNFTVEESLTAARVDLTVLNMNLQPVVIATYFLNKANNAEITAAAFAESFEVEEVVVEVSEVYEGEEVYVDPTEEEVEVIEVVMVPLRHHAEAAGFEISWNAELARVTVSNDELEFSLAADSPFAIDADGEQFMLEAAPVNLDGTLYVPLSFFTELLGVEVVLVPVVTLPAPVPVVEEEEVEDEEEEEVEEVEETEEEEVEEYEEYEEETEEYEEE